MTRPSAPSRDRDAAGRPRNARPRDEFGRPLPRDASGELPPPDERDLAQGLAQVAVGLTHAQRGNARGAAALLRRGGLRVAGYVGSAPHGIAAEAVARFAADLADRIERDGVAAATSATPRPRLRADA